MEYVSAETATEESIEAAIDEALRIAVANMPEREHPPGTPRRVALDDYLDLFRKG